MPMQKSATCLLKQLSACYKRASGKMSCDFMLLIAEKDKKFFSKRSVMNFIKRFGNVTIKVLDATSLWEFDSQKIYDITFIAPELMPKKNFDLLLFNEMDRLFPDFDGVLSFMPESSQQIMGLAIGKNFDYLSSRNKLRYNNPNTGYFEYLIASHMLHKGKIFKGSEVGNFQAGISFCDIDYQVDQELLFERLKEISSCAQDNCFDRQKFVLMTSLYPEMHQERIREYIYCLDRNLKNPFIKKIHILYEDVNDKEHTHELLRYMQNKSIEITYVSKRPSYADFFKIANENYEQANIIVCNADIYFNRTLAWLLFCDLEKYFMALTRWDFNQNEVIELFTRNGNIACDSQDVWILKTPIAQLPDARYCLGIPGCDNHIASWAYQVGLSLSNPCLSIQACHVHSSAIRNYRNSDRYQNLPQVWGIEPVFINQVSKIYTYQ